MMAVPWCCSVLQAKAGKSNRSRLPTRETKIHCMRREMSPSISQLTLRIRPALWLIFLGAFLEKPFSNTAPDHGLIPSSIIHSCLTVSRLAECVACAFALVSLDRSMMASPAVAAFAIVLIAYTTLSILRAIYNLHFHSLRRFPGPRFAAVSEWWKTKVEKPFSRTVIQFRKHRIDPCFNDLKICT
jgi:hypothetical protein